MQAKHKLPPSSPTSLSIGRLKLLAVETVFQQQCPSPVLKRFWLPTALCICLTDELQTDQREEVCLLFAHQIAKTSFRCKTWRLFLSVSFPQLFDWFQILPKFSRQAGNLPALRRLSTFSSVFTIKSSSCENCDIILPKHCYLWHPHILNSFKKTTWFIPYLAEDEQIITLVRRDKIHELLNGLSFPAQTNTHTLSFLFYSLSPTPPPKNCFKAGPPWGYFSHLWS